MSNYLIASHIFLHLAITSSTFSFPDSYMSNLNPSDNTIITMTINLYRLYISMFDGQVKTPLHLEKRKCMLIRS